MEDMNMQGQIQYPGNMQGVRTTTMQSSVATGFGIAAGVGLFILAMYGLSYALRGK
jgi:hypothetical protein